MLKLKDIRAAKSVSYPDQALYAEYAARACDLIFAAIDDDSGLAFSIASASKRIWFGGGRCSYFPQNNATAATLAADKYLSAIVLEAAGVPTLGGQYFFLTDRHRANRLPGHERDDAIAHFHAMRTEVFVKPLTGSRGDFAQAVHDEAALLKYLDDVARFYDAIIMQPIFTGDEYRVFVLDNTVLYAARKYSPVIIGNGVSTVRDLLAENDARLLERGISGSIARENLDAVPPSGMRWPLPGRMNRSAGGDMAFADLPDDAAALAIKAVTALGLRAGGVDIFAAIDGTPDMRVIEINANPSIRFLEDSGRDDLILAIWRHTFLAMGLLDV